MAEARVYTLPLKQIPSLPRVLVLFPTVQQPEQRTAEEGLQPEGYLEECWKRSELCREKVEYLLLCCWCFAICLCCVEKI
ncbi:hypothetical protein Hanom_Chr14g01287741 [Helianthus anomalus]